MKDKRILINALHAYEDILECIEYWFTDSDNAYSFDQVIGNLKAQLEEQEPRYFLSHPRAGNVEENLKDASEIAEYFRDRYNLIEPFKEIPQDGSISEEEAMKRCIELLLDSKGIIMTGDWKNSIGCNLEYQIARATGKEIILTEGDND